MFHLACKIPHDIVIACSGGPDSMALLSFCQAGKKNITVQHIDHGTEHSKKARELVQAYCDKHNLPLNVDEVPIYIEQTELAWRNYRLESYKGFTHHGMTVATAHHLDDAIEWYLLTSLHGGPKFMEPIDAEHKLIKPFLYAEKEQLIEWCKAKDIPYVTDPTNIGQDNSRAVLRESVMPGLLKIHSGMKTSIKHKMMQAQVRTWRDNE